MTLDHTFAFLWAAACTYAYSTFEATRALAQHGPEAVPTLSLAMSETHLVLYGIVPGWIILAGWQITNMNSDQLLIRFGRRSKFVARIALHRAIIGILLSVSMMVGGAIALLHVGEPLVIDASEVIFVALVLALAYSAIASMMVVVFTSRRSKHRLDVWISVLIWLATCVVLLRASEAVRWTPLGAILPFRAEAAWIAPALSVVAVLCFITFAYLQDKQERTRCLQR